MRIARHSLPFLTLLFAASLVSIHAQTVSSTPAELEGKRLDIATRWLSSLCVLSSGDFYSVGVQDLDEAFNAWIQKTTTTCNKPAPIKVGKSTVDLRYLKRLARVGELRLQRQQLATSVIGVTQGDASTVLPRPLTNPQSAIYAFGGPVHFDEFYVGADVRSAMCALNDNFTQPDPHCSDRKYVSAGRDKDIYSRGLAAITLDLNFAQVPLFQNGLLVTDPAAIHYPRWTKTVTGNLDPKKLFRSTAEWKGFAANLGKLPSPFADKGKITDQALQTLCGLPQTISPLLSNEQVAEDCLRYITIGGKTQRLILSVMPTINVAATTPFELSKQGTSYRSSNSAGESLYTVTANWNLRNIFAPASTRVDALNTLKASDPRTPDKLTVADDEKLRIRARVQRMYIELKETPEVVQKDLWWDRFETAVLLIQ